MRVIAGSARGLRLTAPAGLQTRPTADRVKEALFSIIASRRALVGACVLDICAGSGSLGIEALSRGAASCSFVEQSRPVLEILEKNLTRTGLASKAECLALDALKGLNLLSRNGKQFDICFFDPPYSSNLYTPVLEALSSFSLLAKDALLIAECSSRSLLAEQFGKLVKIDSRIYGDTALEFFVREST
ncbi:MAG: 16S rRNA (guanine(966)-N(2))-methyltransferase RsmD [Desulfuromonadales bacterium]|nr:16S rRNA (guanine(966)-N(2))-methyltransferase RsmD [Desulfuromonadales bacterium]